MRSLKAVAAALILGVLLIGPPLALITFIGNPWPPEGISMTGALTDGAIIGLLAVAVWVLWAQTVLCIVVEAVAAVTDDRVLLHAPFTLGVQQQLARRLVTAVVVATVVSPVAMGGAAHAASPAPAPATAAADTAGTAATKAQVREVTTETATTTTVTVMRLDTLMDLAERHLGDADRWQEIADLNEGRQMVDGAVFRSADYIRPGWQLLVPSDAASATGAVVVEKGDSLSKIALEELGDADQWPAIYKANRDVVGSDPNLIFPGQHIELPGSAGEAPAPTVEHPAAPDAEFPTPATPDVIDDVHVQSNRDVPSEEIPDAPTSPVPAPVEVTPQGLEDATPDIAPGRVDAGSETAVDAEQDNAISALSALLASAACLSAGALGMLLANRRRQWRQRPIGRMIASTPGELVDVEAAIIEHGAPAQRDSEFIDRALRYVSATCKVAGTALPALGAAVLGEDDLTLLFTHSAPGAVPEGWTATEDGRAWILPRSTYLEEELEQQPAPYPALVSVGLDAGGHTWLLDLETLGMCGIGGDPQQVADVARFMVAELAGNAWSAGCEVLLADEFAAETVRLNPARVRQIGRADALARAAVLTGEMAEGEQNLAADVLTRRRDGLLLDTTNPVVVVVSSRPDAEFVADLETRDRSRVVVLHGDEESPAIELAVDGTAFLPMWGISIQAFSMPAELAAPMADLMQASRNLNDEPIPNMTSDEGPLGKYARADGSLREEYTAPRRTEGDDQSSMLPEADPVYLATAATTPEDLAAMAPSVPAEIRAEIAALDPTLDQDLADWNDPTSPRPKVHLLGPVTLTALNGGDPSAITGARGAVSFIAYLACQERGVSAERAASACGWSTTRTVQNRATNARFLLGTRRDGSDWLPDASLSAGALRGGTPTYELVRDPGGVLNSGDLFIRLKNRAERRGADGCVEDLSAALSLVTGAPFEGGTEAQFKWLFKAGQQRHDDILVAAITDAAHTLATRAVTDGRTDLVRLACEAARKANPHSDIAWLDQAAATEAESGRAAAGRLVREQILDRFDEDLPDRSEAIVEQREWSATG